MPIKWKLCIFSSLFVKNFLLFRKIKKLSTNKLINDKHKSLIHFFLSFVFTVAKAKILANNELFFKSGSDINLTCVSLQATQPPSYIYWYKDGYLINYSQRGGINVLTERQTRTSTLVISRAVPPDSGNYTCFPSNTSKYTH